MNLKYAKLQIGFDLNKLSQNLAQESKTLFRVHTTFTKSVNESMAFIKKYACVFIPVIYL